MWIPKTEQDVISASETRALEESSIFDAKRDLSTKNHEIAKDIAAMANDGGVLVYGMGEDESGRPCILNPIPLAGQPERIDSIVRTAIAESPTVHISTIPTNSDPGLGYVVVHVPLSERAPHMVVVKGENRYYGRTATGNTILTEAEVARLYERRKRWEVDREQLLQAEIDASPLAPTDGFAFLYVVARPTASSDQFLEQAIGSTETVSCVLSESIKKASAPEVFPQLYSPDFHMLQPQWIQRAEGFRTQTWQEEPKNPKSTLNVQIDFDGDGHLFCGRVGQREQGQFVFFSEIAAGIAVRFFALMGALANRAGYSGPIDIGVATTGLSGSVPYNARYSLPGWPCTPYDRDEYRRTGRFSALDLCSDPKAIARRLLKPLFDAMSQGHLDPFRQK